MSSDPVKKSGADSIVAAEFPALRSFLRGYFHQDMKDEYASAAEAAREFCEDASSEERSAVAREWTRFLEQTRALPLPDVNRLLTGPLGSSYAVTSEDVQLLTQIFSKAIKKQK